MTRSVRAPLILVLLVSLVFAGYWQFFGVYNVQSAHAAGATPAAPTGGRDYFRYANANDTSSIMGDYSSNGSTLTTSYNFQLSASGVTAANIQGENASIKAMKYFWAYNLSTGSNVFMIVGSKYSDPTADNADKLTYFCGLYFHARTSPDAYSPISSADLSTTKPGHFTSVSGTFFDFAPTDTPDSSAEYFGRLSIRQIGQAEINYAGTLSDQCNNLAPLWNQYVTDFTTLFQKDPKSNSQYWQLKSQPSTSSGTGVTWKSLASDAVVAAIPGGQFAKTFVSTAGSMITSWGQSFTLGYELNNDGIAKATSMRNNAKTMVSILETIKSHGNAWPTGCTIPGLLSQDWTISLNDHFSTPQVMEDYLNSMINMFNGLMGTYGAAAGGGVCGNILSGSTSGDLTKILYGMLCGIASLVHNTANFAMTKAIALLNQFVGVEVPNETFTQSAVNYIDTTSGAVTTAPTNNTSPASTFTGTFKISGAATAAQKAKVVAFITALHSYSGSLTGKIEAVKQNTYQGSSQAATISASGFSSDNTSFTGSVTYPQAYGLGTADSVAFILSFTDTSSKNWAAAFGAPVSGGKITGTNVFANDSSSSAPPSN